MSEIKIDQPDSQSPWEETFVIPNLRPRRDLVVISGYAGFKDQHLTWSGGGPNYGISGTLSGHAGDTDDINDHFYQNYEIDMLVGPLWERIYDVSPIVIPAGFTHNSSDEADATGYEMLSCTWEEPEENPRRIRLKAELRSKGGPNASITKLAYHLTAWGRLTPSSKDQSSWEGPKK
jgi:hypothetical protein